MKWISVKDRLPEQEYNGKDMMNEEIVLFQVIVCDRGKRVFTDFRAASKVHKCGWQWTSGLDITHWMPLPEPPEE